MSAYSASRLACTVNSGNLQTHAGIGLLLRLTFVFSASLTQAGTWSLSKLGFSCKVSSHTPAVSLQLSEAHSGKFE